MKCQNVEYVIDEYVLVCKKMFDQNRTPVILVKISMQV